MRGLNGFAARIERLEQELNPLPSLVLDFRQGTETYAEARVRIFAEHGIPEHAAVSFALLEEFDRDV